MLVNYTDRFTLGVIPPPGVGIGIEMVFNDIGKWLILVLN